MNALLKKAEDLGIPADDAKSTIGGVLSFVKAKLGEEQFQAICDKVPGAADAVAETEASRAAGSSGSGGGGGGGLMGMASSFMTKMQGDGGEVGSVPELMTFLSSLGVDTKDIAKYLPEVAKVIKQKTGTDVSSILGVPGGDA